MEEVENRGRKEEHIPENIVSRMEELRELGLGYRKIMKNIEKEIGPISLYKVQKVCRKYDKLKEQQNI